MYPLRYGRNSKLHVWSIEVNYITIAYIPLNSLTCFQTFTGSILVAVNPYKELGIYEQVKLGYEMFSFS